MYLRVRDLLCKFARKSYVRYEEETELEILRSAVTLSMRYCVVVCLVVGRGYDEKFRRMVMRVMFHM